MKRKREIMQIQIANSLKMAMKLFSLSIIGKVEEKMINMLKMAKSAART